MCNQWQHQLYTTEHNYELKIEVLYLLWDFFGHNYFSQIEAIGSDAAATDVTPVSGYLNFFEGERYREIQVVSVDDGIPEPSKFYVLQLTNANEGARVELGEHFASITGETIYSVIKK